MDWKKAAEKSLMKWNERSKKMGIEDSWWNFEHFLERSQLKWNREWNESLCFFIVRNFVAYEKPQLRFGASVAETESAIRIEWNGIEWRIYEEEGIWAFPLEIWGDKDKNQAELWGLSSLEVSSALRLATSD